MPNKIFCALCLVQELEDALTLTQEDFKEKYGFLQLDTSDENLVITCRSGRRVGIANDILKAKGFTKHKELNRIGVSERRPCPAKLQEEGRHAISKIKRAVSLKIMIKENKRFNIPAERD
ncbi:putative thiosulfate sulfurtransferase, mitochondrial [Portunus trituberculatus]|uniref:Putative thiosulfate sulfurtransferase, mitochondrial n=1 Tax=Portunus trituberculatus TaxID=210409 RepID=A0A5B7JHV5_PORTR|nr:putative thiosulfate sulfurtransferase, mitochondrial [Portunus trituberculatus]